MEVMLTTGLALSKPRWRSRRCGFPVLCEQTTRAMLHRYIGSFLNITRTCTCSLQTLLLGKGVLPKIRVCICESSLLHWCL